MNFFFPEVRYLVWFERALTLIDGGANMWLKIESQFQYGRNLTTLTNYGIILI